MKSATHPACLAVLAISIAWSLGARADEVLPAAAATEDLKAFDQSVIVPERPASGAIGAAISAEARKLRVEGRQSPKALGTTLNRNSGKAGASTPNETNPSNSVSNAGKKPDQKTPKNPNRSGR